jgi:hypothetical protein
MTKRTVLFSLLCVVAAACGGNSGGNAAASKQFTYGQPIAATSAQASALQGSLSSMTSLQGAPDASTAAGFTEFSDVSSALIGADTFGLTSAPVLAQHKALTSARKAAFISPTNYGTNFDNPDCVAVTSTSVKLSGCTVTVTETQSGETATAKVTANGTVTLSNAKQTLTWDLTLALNVTVTGTSGSGSGGGRFHAAGDLTVSAPTATAEGTVKGRMTTEVSLSASASGQSASMRVDESLDIDITYQTNPSTCVTGGTVEAKRVFAEWSIPNVSRPTDKGAKVTWQSCGNGSIAFSTN